MSWVGPAIAAGGSILGGMIGSKGTSRKRERDSIEIGYQEMVRNIPKQMKATMDAAKANGIHPTVALGLPVTSMSSGGASVGGHDWASTARDLGQNIGAAISRRQTPDERAFAAVTAAQAVERGDLENELLKSQIAQIRSSINPARYTGQPQIIDGQAQSGQVSTVLKEVFGGSDNGMEFGNPPGLATINYKGFPVRVPGKGWSDANLDDGPASWQIQLLNTVPDLTKAELNAFIRDTKNAWRNRNNGPRINPFHDMFKYYFKRR